MSRPASKSFLEALRKSRELPAARAGVRRKEGLLSTHKRMIERLLRAELELLERRMSGAKARIDARPDALWVPSEMRSIERDQKAVELARDALQRLKHKGDV